MKTVATQSVGTREQGGRFFRGANGDDEVFGDERRDFAGLSSFTSSFASSAAVFRFTSSLVSHAVRSADSGPYVRRMADSPDLGDFHRVSWRWPAVISREHVVRCAFSSFAGYPG
jgi:hypothetical protein